MLETEIFSKKKKRKKKKKMNKDTLESNFLIMHEIKFLLDNFFLVGMCKII